MRVKGNYMYALASFIAAFAVGYFVQNRDDDTAIFAPTKTSFESENTSSKLVDPTTIQHTSAPTEHVTKLPSAPIVSMRLGRLNQFETSLSQRMSESLGENPIKDFPMFSAYGVPCAITLDARVGAGAVIFLDISASCAPNQMFKVQQGDLLISGMTSNVGLARIGIPAMSHDPQFEITFEGGQTVSESVKVNDFDNFDRVALQWQGPTGLEIHALEFGADYGQAGHVWHKSPRTAGHILGGFISRVGGIDSPTAHHAEIYSFPTGTIGRDGAVRLSVEAEITKANCGRTILAQTLQPKSLTGIEVVDLNLTMPDCSAIGDFLVLNNLLRDLKIALN